MIQVLCAKTTNASTTNPSSTPPLANKTYSAAATRSFDQLDPFASLDKTQATQAFLGAAALPEMIVEDQDIADTRAKIDATYQKIRATNKVTTFLDKEALASMPIGIDRSIGALSYMIMFDSVEVTPQETLLHASMRFETPNAGVLHFKGTAKYAKEGGIVSDAVLFLVGEKRENSEGGKTQLYIRGGQNKTFIEFDCKGFVQMGVDIGLIFSRDLLLPVDKQNKVIDNGQVQAEIATVLTDWNDMLIEVTLPAFQMVGLKDFIFRAETAIIDLSDTQNAPAVKFPSEYTKVSPYFISGNPNLWRGVYIRSLQVTLPGAFKTKEANNQNTPVTLTGSNMLIDNMGFSGGIKVSNEIIPLDKGKMGNWSYSLGGMNVQLLTNNITSFGFSGLIDIPINTKKEGEVKQEGEDSQAKKLFSYSAVIQSGGDFLFTVKNADELNFDLWKAKAVIYPSSYLEVNVIDGKFRPKAHLNGKMDMNIGLKSDDGTSEANASKNLQLKEIRFEGLELQSVKPYIKVGSFSLGVSGSGMGGFPLSVTKFEGGTLSNNDTYFDVEITLQLTPASGDALGATGGFRIISAPKEETDGDLKFRFKKLQINRFGVNIKKGSVGIVGDIIFFREDKVYGTGIAGSVTLELTSIKATAKAVFGSVDGYRFWYADALVDLGSTMPIFTGVFVNQLGGGAYYHMAQSGRATGSTIGESSSGVGYVPDKNVGLGVKAMMGLAGANEKMMKASVAFEMAFRASGGLKSISFRGTASLMSDLPGLSKEKVAELTKKLAEKSKGMTEINNKPEVANSVIGENRDGASIYGEVNIVYNFDEPSLHATFFLDIKAAGGLITGGGRAVMHFDPKQWYVYIGRPEYENRFNLTILGMMRADAYFVMGSVVPNTPPPPAKVAEIVGGMDLDYMKELNQMANGAGIGFGASFSFDTGQKNFLIFYGHFNMGAGFDVMLKDYGDVQCAGTGQLGIDGWYANGQAYAYFDGEIGIRVKILGNKKNVKILAIGAAVVVQASLPNPVWMRGVVGGHFSVLGGLVKGNCKFDLEIGKQCEIIEGGSGDSALDGLEILAQLTPADAAYGVDVFTLPQAVFNYEMNKEYEYVEGEQRVKFRIKLEQFELKHAGQTIIATTKWSNDQLTAVLRPKEILPSESDVKLKLVAIFQEYKNGQWVNSQVEGQDLKEIHELSFKTDKAPNYIRESNIEYMYPLQAMVNYYPEEHTSGYIKLIQGQSYLFEDPSFTSKVRFATGANAKEVSMSYSTSDNQLSFNIPTDLINGKVYTMDVVGVPTVTTQIEGNITVDSTSVDIGGGDGESEAKMRTRTAEGTVTNYEEQNYFHGFFRVSNYDRFADKAAAVISGIHFRDPLDILVHRVGVNLTGTEPFGNDEMVQLITLEADPSNVPWYKNKIYPKIYADYPINGRLNIRASNRDVDVLGIIPVKAVYLWQYPYNVSLAQDAIYAGAANLPRPEGTLSYMLARYMYDDYVDLSNQAANLYSNGSASNRVRKLLEGNFPMIEGGAYPIKVNYTLPGTGAVTSTFSYNVMNPIY